MRITVLIALLLISASSLFGQGLLQSEQPSPVKWNISISKTEIPFEYEIRAVAELDAHWHVFDLEPGGDGLLIGPEFQFATHHIEIISVKAKGDLITKDMDGVGVVRYYENEVSFIAHVRAKTQEIKGTIYYQLCDPEKCLPPTEVPFTLSLN